MSYKAGQARCMMQASPEKWFGTSEIDVRDLELLIAPPVNFVKYEQKSPFVQKVYSKQAGKPFGMMDVTVENTEEIKEMIKQAGGDLVGFPVSTQPHKKWQSVVVNVNIAGAPKSGFDWGFLSTDAQNIRVFKGPPETCSLHTWDAMILRDCTTNSENLHAIDRIAKRKWDILAMKCCEDFDMPWIVVCIKYAGDLKRADRPPCSSGT